MTRTELFLNNVWTLLCKKHGVSEADRLFGPLSWYVTTGRASASFLQILCEQKPFMIARRLEKGGSYDEAVQRVKEYVYREEK